MRWRGTLVLAAALAVAVLWLAIELAAEHGPLSWESVLGTGQDVPPGERITHLLSFNPTDITAIRVRRGDAEWRTERRGDKWTGVDRSAAVDDFLASLLDLAEVMPLDVPADELAAHGLDPPEAVIELSRPQQPPVVLYLGRNNPPATGVYAKLGGDGRVVLTGALAMWELDKVVRALSPTAAGP